MKYYLSIILCILIPLHIYGGTFNLTVYIDNPDVPSTEGSGGGEGGSSGGGGGGGSTPSLPRYVSQGVVVRGIAYPGSQVTLLKDGQFVTSTVAGPDAQFEINFSDVTQGTYTFNVWAKDSKGNRSVTFPFTVHLTSGVTNVISGIFLPPTISVDKKQVRRGDPITVIGAAVPNAHVSVFFNSPVEIIKNVTADAKGLWVYTMDSLELEYGTHATKARSKKDADISTFSQKIGFVVGTNNVAASAQSVSQSADLNGDKSVNLIDFSMLLYWYKRPLIATTPAGVDLNSDGKVDLADFSIMAYQWTG